MLLLTDVVCKYHLIAYLLSSACWDLLLASESSVVKRLFQYYQLSREKNTPTNLCLFFTVQGLTACLWTLWTRALSHTCPACKSWTSAQEALTSPLKWTRWMVIRWRRRSRRHKTRSTELTLDCIVSWTERAFKWEWTCECHFPCPLLCCEWLIFLVQDTGWSYFSFLFLGWLELHISISEL